MQIYQLLGDGQANVYTAMAVAPNGDFIALYTDTGLIRVFSTDFKVRMCAFNRISFAISFRKTLLKLIVATRGRRSSSYGLTFAVTRRR